MLNQEISYWLKCSEIAVNEMCLRLSNLGKQFVKNGQKIQSFYESKLNGLNQGIFYSCKTLVSKLKFVDLQSTESTVYSLVQSETLFVTENGHKPNHFYKAP